MSEENKNTVLKVAAGTLVAGTAAYTGFCYYVFREIFDLQDSSFRMSHTWNRSNNQERNNEWFSNSKKTEDYIHSYDGLVLHGTRIQNHPESHRWIVMQHGYYSVGMEAGDYLYEFDRLGFNILTVDSRGCGQSKGRYTGMGWPEHYDLISFINYLVHIEPEAEIALFGVSMGATSVMYATGDFLPENVKCAIEDSGSADVKLLIEKKIAHEFGIPGTPFIPGIDFFVKQCLHYSMKDVSVLRQLNQSNTPTLFIQSDADEEIPASMIYDCYYACNTTKELLSVKGRAHGQAYKADNYFNRIKEFTDKYLK